MPGEFIVLGLNYGGHDTSAALMREGELLAACEQERYTGDKHSRLFPVDAVQDCFQQAGIKQSDLSEVGFAFDPTYHIKEAYLVPAMNDPTKVERIIDDIEKIKENFAIESLIRNKLNYGGRISYFNHHLCHLASTYYPSGFSEALLSSYDGIGEVQSGMIGIGRSGKIEIIHGSSVFPDSLGLLYSAVTYYLGWRHHCDEGIVMGLATYGDPTNEVPGEGRTYKEVFEEIITVPDAYNYCVEENWITYHKKRDSWVSDHFYDVFGPKRDTDGEIEQHHMDIAAGMQARLQDVVIDQLRYASEQTKLRKLCLSGGVALNCSLNGEIERQQIFDEIFVQPASGDAGVAIGACYLATAEQRSNLQPKKQHNFYLGSGFSKDEIIALLEELELDYETPDNIFRSTAKYLEQGKIVGWFQGRAEFGPRALGNRSILTRPYPASMKDYLNSRVKFRESFRPFAPAVLSERASDYFEIQQESPHMLIATQATSLARKKIPATVHVDNSCRVQTVRKENNPRFYDLLCSFHELTNCPVLLNTSFNVKGQPIVNTPKQAIHCYQSTNIDCLILGDILLVKQ